MSQSIAVFDDRPFFEKALAYGVQHGILDAAKLAAIQTDAPKGMVQIARYFGNEFLRPELEKAKDRIVNLVSLTLELHSGGDLRQAAEHLREHSFMSRSKAASDMLKALIVMPQSTHFGMHDLRVFSDAHIPQLATWSLRSLADYQAELAKRQQTTHIVQAAIWMAEALDLQVDDLEEAGCDAEAVIRTALLVGAVKQKEMPDWVAFEKIIATLRKPSANKTITWVLPKKLPAELKPAVQRICQSVEDDLPKILDPKLTPQKLFYATSPSVMPPLLGRYFWRQDSLTEVDHLDRQISAAWAQATGGHSDDSSLLTLFLCIATGSPAKTLLTEKTAATLIRKIRKSGVQSDWVTQFIQTQAPAEHQDDYIDLWESFIDDALVTLESDHSGKLHDALALLRRECNVAD
jgi:hypothetical protein